MNRACLPSICLLLLAALAGCASTQPESPTMSGDGLGAGTPPDGPGVVFLKPPTERPLKFHFDLHLTAAPFPLDCGPSTPGTCREYLTGSANLSGDVVGNAVDSGFLYWESGSRFNAREWFRVTADVAGCGSGTFTLANIGTGALEPDAGGVIHILADLHLVAGSTSTGLVGLVAMNVTGDWRLNGQFGSGDLAGTISCAEVVNDEKAKAVGPGEQAFKFHFDAHLTFAPYPVDCAAAKTWVCDEYWTGNVNLTGGLVGTASLSGHVHHKGGAVVWAQEYYRFSGTVAGCGSGSFSMVLNGTVTAEANPAGISHLMARADLVPGSTSTGLAGLMRLHALGDWRQSGQFGSGDLEGTVSCSDVKAPGKDAAHAARERPLKFHFDAHITLAPDPVDCNAARAWVCDEYWTGNAEMSGGLVGNAILQGHVHYDAGTRAWARESYEFSGQVLDCGSGAFTLTVPGAGTVEPNTGGVLHLQAAVDLVSGSTSTGLSSLASIHGKADIRLTGQFGSGDVEVTVAC